LDQLNSHIVVVQRESKAAKQCDSIAAKQGEGIAAKQCEKEGAYNERQISVLLYGPPGTGKTAIASCVGTVLMTAIASCVGTVLMTSIASCVGTVLHYAPCTIHHALCSTNDSHRIMRRYSTTLCTMHHTPCIMQY
jgi:predicted ATPase with chaperone activity